MTGIATDGEQAPRINVRTKARAPTSEESYLRV